MVMNMKDLRRLLEYLNIIMKIGEEFSNALGEE